ncbi:4Fe-4S ferredoxin [Fervidicella metallireducens AeB]|uniref:4Fe-4S ferredoxin n=1 Tax=Fervidicella metallireducens AeB TaxID=1403537 RepID=A0A017RU90_9CLOT|nr:4Fe-4S dicluster domain-containing protein [Fervidicella metallireducens]EYE87455.1 4Fe-4S ferredoxin [Fervidicella metallireducens AeB]
MSKTWYPVIDYSQCKECGACINKCKHGVYEQRKNRPVVVNPEGCVHGCRGCQNLCPSGAIQYVGDTDGNNSCSCGCSGCC